MNADSWEDAERVNVTRNSIHGDEVEFRRRTFSTELEITELNNAKISLSEVGAVSVMLYSVPIILRKETTNRKEDIEDAIQML